MADAGQKDVRIEAALAKLWCHRDQLPDRRRTGADPGRPRLRDGRVAGGPRRARRPRRAAAARPADQPDLRGLVRDHAAADRPRGRGRPPAAAGDLASADASLSDKAQAAVGASGFYARWLPKLVAGSRHGSAVVQRLRPAGQAPALRGAVLARLARQTFYGMGRWQGGLEHKQAFLGRIVDIGAELFAITRGLRQGRGGRPRPGPPAVRAGRRVLPSGAAAGRRRCSPNSGTTATTRTSGWRLRARRPLQLPRGGHSRPVHRRALDRVAAGWGERAEKDPLTPGLDRM